MRAADTNVLARYLLQDDDRQSHIAGEIIAAGVYISSTVLLELGWLLTSRYGLTRDIVADLLTDLLDIPAVHVDRPADILWATERFAKGADFADMIHLVGAAPATAFATFDRGVAKAATNSPIPVETLA